MVILLVEDEVEIRETIVEILVDEKHTVIATGRGKEAVFIARDRRDIDLFLLDIGLPDLDGWTIAKMVRKWYPTAPIYILTAWTVMKQFQDAHRVHVDGVFFKPFDIGLILDICHRHQAANPLR